MELADFFFDVGEPAGARAGVGAESFVGAFMFVVEERAAEADPRVQDVLARFPGAKVVEVRKFALSSPDSDAAPDEPADDLDSND